MIFYFLSDQSLQQHQAAFHQQAHDRGFEQIRCKDLVRAPRGETGIVEAFHLS